MPRKAPVYTPVESPPSGADLCAEGVLTMEQAAKFAGLSAKTLTRLMVAGELPWVKTRHRRLVPRKALVAWLAARVRTV